MGEEEELIRQLFHCEFAKMVAVIGRRAGLQHLELAEDIASETFLQATQQWRVKGIPPNPAAWLFAVAKQKTAYHFRRKKIFTGKVLPHLQGSVTGQDGAAVLDFSVENIRDSQLQMLFAVCNPVIAGEAQIGLALRILCGFGIDEIADAFFTGRATVNKRLFRAKEKLRTENVRLQMPPARGLPARLDAVLHVLYLLFNEGYYSAMQNPALRKDFCLEAMRLALLLMDCPETAVPKTAALLSLMCFHASRFDARQSGEAGLLLYDQQNKSLWNDELIQQGHRYLAASAEGSRMTSYHLEAAIAALHCNKNDTPEKWTQILEYYDLLLAVNGSPGVLLNRLYALYKARGAAAALPEAEGLQMTGSHFYFTLLGELYKESDVQKAGASYAKALGLAKTPADKELLKQKIEELKK